MDLFDRCGNMRQARLEIGRIDRVLANHGSILFRGKNTSALRMDATEALAAACEELLDVIQARARTIIDNKYKIMVAKARGKLKAAEAGLEESED